ncbi:MAG: hypothetical protein V4538_14895 [Bacteroidota bacterium]
MEQNKQKGGKRLGAGRKPVLSKKKQISLYVEGSKILKFGNDEKMKKYLYKVIETFGNSPIDYKPPTEANFHGKMVSMEVVDKMDVEQQKSSITGLPPKLSDFDKFSEELRSAKSRHDVDAIMKRSVGGIMFPKERFALKSVADEVMEDMFND